MRRVMNAGLFGAGVGIAVALSSCGAARATSSAVETAAWPGPITAIVDTRVFDGESFSDDATVVIAGEEIVAVGRDIALPADATIIDGSGLTLLPGLIDAHAHVWDATHLETSLSFGVTTVLDMMTPAAAASRFRADEETEAGLTRADIRSAGYAATAPGGHGTEYGIPVPTLSTPAEAAAFVAERVAEGSDYIKIIHDDGSLYSAQRIPTLDEPTVRALVDAAHVHGRLAVVHPGTLDGARAALRAGADGLAHVWGDSVPSVDFIDRMRADSMFVVPTLSVQSSVGGGVEGAVALDEEQALLDADAVENVRRAFPVAPGSRASYAAAAASVAMLREHGVPVLVGSDAPNPGTWYGITVHDEMKRLVRDAGFSPAEALRAATSAPADAFGLRDRGRIRIGMRADLLLVRGDPRVTIDATREIVAVWKRGHRLDLDAVRARVARRRAAAERVAEATPVGPEGLMLSDFDGETPSSAMGRWVVSTDQLAGGTSTGAMRVEGGALLVSGTVNSGVPFAWSGVMLFPAAQPMQPVNLSSARGVSFRARGPGVYSVALFTERGGRIPSIARFQTTTEWQSYQFGWSDFGEHDGSDVQGIAIFAGPQPGNYEFAIDDVELQGR